MNKLKKTLLAVALTVAMSPSHGGVVVTNPTSLANAIINAVQAAASSAAEIAQDAASSAAEIASERASSVSVSGSMAKVKGAITKSFEAQNQAIRDIAVQTGIADAAVRAQEQYGPEGTLDGACEGPVAAASVQNGIKTQDEISRDLRGAYDAYSTSINKSIDSINLVESIEAISYDKTKLYDQGATLTSEELVVKAALTRIDMDPSPPAALTAAQEGTLKGREYKTTVRQRQAGMDPVAAVLSSLTSLDGGTIDAGTWVQSLYEEMGSTGVSPKIVDGKISMNAYLDLRAQEGVANPNWADESSRKMSESKLRRNALKHVALQTYIQNEQLKYLKSIAYLLSVSRAQGVRETFDVKLKIAKQGIK